ncbi:MAG: hypothetical protein K9I36_16730 [Bacteroidia bacterium]|nr:hypothetical protein [Bacteroidia bacterium]
MILRQQTDHLAILSLQVDLIPENEMHDYLLKVAIRTTISGRWKAYQLPVKTISTPALSDCILRGNKLSKTMATRFFPTLETHKYED